MRALEERVASIEGAMTPNQQQQQEARSTAHLESSPGLDDVAASLLRSTQSENELNY